jgi:hypothetical protein
VGEFEGVDKMANEDQTLLSGGTGLVVQSPMLGRALA